MKSFGQTYKIPSHSIKFFFFLSVIPKILSQSGDTIYNFQINLISRLKVRMCASPKLTDHITLNKIFMIKMIARIDMCNQNWMLVMNTLKL